MINVHRKSLIALGKGVHINCELSASALVVLNVIEVPRGYTVGVPTRHVRGPYVVRPERRPAHRTAMVERPGGVRKEQGVVGFEREALGEQRVGLRDSRPPNEALRWDQTTPERGQLLRPVAAGLWRRAHPDAM